MADVVARLAVVTWSVSFACSEGDRMPRVTPLKREQTTGETRATFEREFNNVLEVELDEYLYEYREGQVLPDGEGKHRR